MFCSKCGQPIQQQEHCTVCGTPTGLGARISNPPVLISRVSRHLQTTGILWIAYAGYTMLHWLLAVTVMRTVFGSGHPWFMGGPDLAHVPFFGPWIIPFVTAILVLRAILSLAVGVALVTRQPWGRTFAIVVSILTLIKLFTGTALAIYTLWVLLGPNAQQDYDQIAGNSMAYR